MEKSKLKNLLGINFDKAETLSSNMNYVYRVKNFLGHNSVILKAVPDNGSLARFPHLRLSAERLKWDTDFNKFANDIMAPVQICPEIYMKDPQHRFFLMEDLGSSNLRTILRNAKPEQVSGIKQVLEKLAIKLSSFYLRQNTITPINNSLLEAHYYHIFEVPLFQQEEARNFWLESGLRENEIKRMQEWQARFMEMSLSRTPLNFLDKGEFLLHGDLHTNSIVIKNNEAFLIDGEFSHSGNIAFDIGMLLANIVIDLSIAGIQDYNYDQKLLEIFIGELALENIHEIKIVMLHEIIRQNIGASFSVPVTAEKSRENLYKSIKELNSDLCNHSFS